MKFQTSFFPLIFLILFSFSKQDVPSDIVSDLPNYNYHNLMYSGYLKAGTYKYFHYIYHVADSDPEHKPLVLWLNGGPGCSSLDGWAAEHGPQTIKKGSDEFTENLYSWNKAANMIYLESPGGVGFSYIDSSVLSELAVDDEITAQDNLNALIDFFNKFSELRDYDFYISGESYAGVYVPTLARLILLYNEKVPATKRIKLKGIMVGNGVADWTYDTEPALFDFVFTHHLISYELRLEFNQYCKEKYDEEQCNKIKEKINELINDVNIYDILQDCEKSSTNDGDNSSNNFYYNYAPWMFKNKNKSKPKNFLEILKENSDNIIKKNTIQFNNKYNLDPPCIDVRNITKYLNQIEVKNALHVNPDITFELCSEDINNRYGVLEKGSIWVYPMLLGKIRIMIYSGDTDMAVPFNGNQECIKNLRLEIKKPWRQWRAYNDNENVSGYRIVYDGLTFATVKGTGHMVPQWKPKEALYLFEKFLNDEDL